MLIFLLSPLVIGLLLLGGWGITTGRAAEACCRRCRYPTAGLHDPTCPECGSDLRARGTLEPEDRIIRRPSRTVAAVCRTLLVVILAFLLAQVVAEYRPWIYSRATVFAGSEGGLFSSVMITGDGASRNYSGWRQRVVRVPTTARLTGPRGVATLRMTTPSGGVRYDSPSGRITPPDGLSVDHVLRWMEAAGVDVTREEAAQQAHDLHTLICCIVAGCVDKPGRLPGLAKVKVKAERWIAPSRGHTAILSLVGVGAWFVILRDLRR